MAWPVSQPAAESGGGKAAKRLLEVGLEVQELLPLTMLVVTVVPGCSTLGSQQFLPLPMDGLAVAAEAAVPTF